MPSNPQKTPKKLQRAPLGPGPDHNLCPKRICQACQSQKSEELSIEEHQKLLDEGAPYQFLKPCCASYMIIGCECGKLREKVTPEVALYWLKGAINPSIE